MVGDVYKFCSKCKETKSISEFHIVLSKKDGHRSHCKICTNKAKTEWGRKNKDKKSEHDYRTRQRDPKKTKDKDMRGRLRYKEKHPDYEKLKSKKMIEELSDVYILKVICRNYNLKRKNIPKEYIESKRMQIKVKRLLKIKKDENTKTC